MSFSSSRAGRLPPFPGRRLFSVHPERNLNLNGRSWSFIVGRGDTAEVRDGATGTKKREKDRPRPGGREGERSRVYKCVYMLERERARVEGEEERREGEKREREREKRATTHGTHCFAVSRTRLWIRSRSRSRSRASTTPTRLRFQPWGKGTRH